MARLTRLLAILLALSALAAACGGSGSDASGSESGSDGATAGSDGGDTSSDGGETATTVERGDKLTLAMLGVLPSFEAADAQFGNNNLYFQAIYDGLLRMETDGKTVVPWLATEYGYNDDLTVLTMTLRDDVTFSDGTAFNADAAVQNLVRLRDGSGAAASLLRNMADAVAVDDTTLEIQLSEPDPGLIGYLADVPGLMQAPSSFGETTNPLGSGPYILDTAATVPDTEYVYTAREDYWAPETVHYNSLVLRPISDGTAAVNAFMAGEVNGGNLATVDAADQIESAGMTLHFQELDWAGFSLIDRCGAMGTPLDNTLVRQAIAHSIDREGILQSFAGGNGTVTGQVFGPSSPGYDAALDTLYPYDPEKAKELMAESGVEPFTMTMPAAFAFFGDAVYAIMSESLAEIGITVTYEEPPVPEFIADLLAPKYPAYFMFLEQNPNPWNAINFLVAPTAIWNPGGCTDDTVTKLVEDIQYSPAGAEQDALIKDLGRHVIEEAWYVPFYRNRTTFVTDANTDVTIQVGNAVPFLWSFVPKA